jgi:hypothetical protein
MLVLALSVTTSPSMKKILVVPSECLAWFRKRHNAVWASDAAVLARDTHRFESRYLDRLIGPYPQEQALYLERLPLRARVLRSRYPARLHVLGPRHVARDRERPAAGLFDHARRFLNGPLRGGQQLARLLPRVLMR